MHIVQIKIRGSPKSGARASFCRDPAELMSMYPIPKPKAEIPLTLWALISCSDPFALMMQLLQLFRTDLERSVTS